MRVLLFSLLLLSVSACVTKPTKYLSQQPIEVNDQTVYDYWQIEGDSFSFRTRTMSSTGSRLADKQGPTAGQTGYLVVRFLIDSNGNTFDPELIESEPANIWNKVAKKAVAAQKFVPAESNELKIPVYYTQRLNFESKAEKPLRYPTPIGL